MRKFALAAGLALAVAPAVANAADSTPTTTDKQNAAKECKALRTSSGTNFTQLVDSMTSQKVTAKNAYGKCVSIKAKDEAQETTNAQKQAKSDCKAQREAATTDEQKAAFATKYGANNSSSAYGKCVSKTAKAKKADADQQDSDRVNAAKACKTERKTDAVKFDKDYSSFGKCVSKKAHEANQKREDERQAEENTTAA